MRDMLVWSALAVDLGEITKKNVDEWVWRLFYQAKTTEAMNLGTQTPAELRKSVERWVGLSTNILTLTRKQWLTKVTEMLERLVIGRERALAEADQEHYPHKQCKHSRQLDRQRFRIPGINAQVSDGGDHYVSTTANQTPDSAHRQSVSHVRVTIYMPLTSCSVASECDSEASGRGRRYAPSQ
jgi:hypothetical protein